MMLLISNFCGVATNLITKTNTENQDFLRHRVRHQGAPGQCRTFPQQIPFFSVETAWKQLDETMDWFKGKSEPETIDFPMKYGAFRLKFSLKPIH
jgi:hypothetical protein